jgi:hypothetical protein
MGVSRDTRWQRAELPQKDVALADKKDDVRLSFPHRASMQSANDIPLHYPGVQRGPRHCENR